MHSSRMRTGRFLTVCRSLLPEGVYLVLRGVYLVLGGAYLVPGGERVSAPEGGQGCLVQRGGVCSRGVSARGVW